MEEEYDDDDKGTATKPTLSHAKSNHREAALPIRHCFCSTRDRPEFVDQHVCIAVSLMFFRIGNHSQALLFSSRKATQYSYIIYRKVESH